MTMSLQQQKKVTYTESLDLLPPSDCRSPGVMRVREELVRLLEPYVPPTGSSEREMFDHYLDDVIAPATVLSTAMLCFYKEGEAEFFWVDPKTQPWPHAEPRLTDDDYFLIRWPGVRKPIASLGDDLDAPDTEPQQKGFLPPPVRDWIRLPMEEVQSPATAVMSLGGRLLKDRNFM